MSPELNAIIAFQLTTAELARLKSFYEGLGFRVGDRERIPDREIVLLDLKGGGTRLPLRLGEQRLDLDSFENPGHPYPTGATNADLNFQHLALVTDDASAAWVRAAALGATPISIDGPVTLPTSAGGVTAVKFRDPEGHPLELLQFPPQKLSRWRGAGIIGIDHSAISVSDVGASRRFYEGLGLAAQGATINHGATQVALDGLAGVEVDVVPMLARREIPHLELLAYRKPVGRAAGSLRANDVAATRIVWAANLDSLVRDPDGHLHLLRRQTSGNF